MTAAGSPVGGDARGRSSSPSPDHVRPVLKCRDAPSRDRVVQRPSNRPPTPPHHPPHLNHHSIQSQDYLERNEVTDRDDAGVLADAVATLLKENNAKVCGGALTCASLAVQGSPDLFRQHVPLFLPGVFDRLGDLKAPVREGARNLLVSLMELRVTPPADVFGKASIGWRHKNWRVREELLRTCEQAFASDALSPEDLSVKATLPQVLNALEDREPGVREAAVSAILGASMRTGPAIHGMLARHTIRPGQLREIQARLADANLGAGAVGGAVSQGGSRPGSRPSPSSAGSDGVRRPGSNAGARARTGVGSPSENAERRPTSTSSTGSGGGGGRGGAASLGSTLGGGYSSSSSTLRPSTTGGLGSTGRLIERVAAGVAQGTAGSDVPPPYGAATGRVIRIAEGDSPAPVNVDSERELSSEIERAANRLDPSKEWTDRVAAMVRLEALLLGGAAEWDCFPGLLGKLRGPLTAQVADRRSSIVRQAAHLLVVLAAELGGEFEKEAAHYVPELFKCVVITVQIIAESGDLGVRGILHNCQARALVPRLCDAASKDRSVKLRCQATGWLRLVVREWDDACLGDRGRDCVEEAILSMVKDGSNDVRAGARRVYADYARRYPDHAARAQVRLDANTRRLIAQESAAGTYDGDDDDWVPGAETMHARTRPHTSQEGSRGAGTRARPAAVRVPGSRLGHSSAPVSPVDGGIDEGDRFGATRGRSNGTSSTLGRSDSLPASTKGVTASRSSGGSGSGSSRNGLGSREGARAASTGAKPAPARQAAAAVAARVIDRAADRSTAAAKTAAPSGQRRIRDSPPNASSNHLAPDLAKYGVSPEPPDVPPAAPTVRAALTRAPSLFRASWEEKVSAFETLAAALRGGGAKARADAMANCAKMADMFCDHAGDAHHRVACAVLEAVVEAVPALGPGLEPHLERLCPALFPRLVDAKESVRGLASAALAAVGDAHAADALLPALLTSLEQSKAPRAKTGVLEFALYVLSGQGGGTDPRGSRGRTPASAGTGGLGAWVSRVAPLTRDRHAPLRAAAAAGLAAVHTRADQAVLLRYLASVPGADAAAVCRAVAPHAPSIEAEFHAYADAMRNDKYSHSSPGGGRYSDEEEEEEEEEEAFGDEVEELRESVPAAEDGNERVGVEGGDVVAAALDRSMERLGVPPSAGGVDGAASLAGFGAEALDRRAAEVSSGKVSADEPPASKGFADEPPIEVAAPPTPGVVAPPSKPPPPPPPPQVPQDDASLDVASLALAEAISAASSAGPASRPRALASVRRALRAGAHPGSDRAGQVLAVALEALASEEGGDEAKTHALFTLRDLAQCAPDAFAPHAAVALPRILDALTAGGDTAGGGGGGGVSVSGEVALSAGDALEGVVEALSPGAAMRALCPHVGRGGAAPVRCLGGVIGRMEPETLMRSTPELIPGLCEAFNSPSADVRKAVVDTLVSMYDVLGDWLLPQLSGLSPAQQKLVTIYINRAMEKNGVGGGKGTAKAGAISIGDASRRPLAPRHQ